MSAAPSLLPVAAAVLLAGLMAVPPAAKSDSPHSNGWYNGGDSGQYNLWVGGNGHKNVLSKKAKKKNGKKKKAKRKNAVVVPEPPMSVLLGTGLLVLGFAAWRKHRRA